MKGAEVMSSEGLSKQQRSILGCICIVFEKYKGRTIIPKTIVRRLYMVSAKGREKPTRSESASFSRALKQLWNRDLVKFYRGADQGRLTRRTTGVNLTEKGSVIAKEFATDKKRRNLEKMLKDRWTRRMMSMTDVAKAMQGLTEMVNAGLK